MKAKVRSKQENLNGNFGAARIKGNPGQLDLTKEILNRDSLRIPNKDEAFTRLVEAYNKTVDPKIKATLWDMLKRRKATLQEHIVKPKLVVSEFAEYCRRVR